MIERMVITDKLTHFKNGKAVMVNVNAKEDTKRKAVAQAIVKVNLETFWKTGIEMEAITAVTISAITIYDMCKAIDKSIEVNSTGLLEKTGGKSGDYKRQLCI